jgi:transcriptional regulator with XRE-family HTH domain
MGYEEDRVRDRIKSERAKNSWTQQQLADRVNKYLRDRPEWRWSTVAKLEAGERGVQLGEASALADVFGISLETLSGRRARPARDLLYTVEALLEAQRMAAWQVPMLARTLRERATEVTDASSAGGAWAELVDDALIACDALDAAAAALERVGKRPDLGVARVTRRLARKWLDEADKEDTDDDT